MTNYYKNNGVIYFEYNIMHNEQIEIVNFSKRVVLDEYVIPEEIDGIPVTRLLERAFAGCHIKKLVLGNRMTFIGVACFENSDLEEIILPETAIPMRRYVFSGCEKLRRISTDRFEMVHMNAFKNCKQLEMSGIMTAYISVGAFEGCESLKELDISAEIISSEAFKGCLGLKKVSISDCHTLWAKAFDNCPALEEAFVCKSVETINHSAEEIAKAAFDKNVKIEIGDDTFD